MDLGLDQIKNNTMKTLVIYYSLDGNTEHLANSMATVAEADLQEVKLKKNITKGIFKYFFALKQMIFDKKPDIIPFEKNIADYDMLVIGTPVWGSNFAPAINSFFNQIDIANKKIALYACFGSSIGNCCENMENILKEKNQIIGQKGFKNPLKNSNVSKKEAEIWIKDMLARC